MEFLYKELNTGSKHNKRIDNTEIPDYITKNLSQIFETRPYQKKAFSRFIYYLENDNFEDKQNKPYSLMFNMATGSGKTMIMAGLILYLCKQGYRNFLFFVNSTNIINKTRDNFLNATASKYLFNESVQINNQQIRIKEVDNFQAANPDDINIVFSTIQGLHTRLNTPRENSLTYDDFESQLTQPWFFWN